MFATGETLGLAEWIIDNTCLVSFRFTRLLISICVKYGFNKECLFEFLFTLYYSTLYSL